jgi:hypothetical protein
VAAVPIASQTTIKKKNITGLKKWGVRLCTDSYGSEHEIHKSWGISVPAGRALGSEEGF